MGTPFLGAAAVFLSYLSHVQQYILPISSIFLAPHYNTYNINEMITAKLGHNVTNSIERQKRVETNHPEGFESHKNQDGGNVK